MIKLPIENKRNAINIELASEITKELLAEIKAKGTASLLVSGGSTPRSLFKLLSTKEIEWEKITITLVDERFLPDNDPNQNGTMVKKTLLQNSAAKATFIPLVFDAKNSANNLILANENIAQITRPFTVVVLGMGTDGHTASLFPDSPELTKGLSENTDVDLIKVNTPSSPYERITFTKKVIMNSKHIYLHCFGSEKKLIIDEVMDRGASMDYPISYFITNSKLNLKIFWAE